MKRQRIEIMAQILAFCTDPKRKTPIMYKNNLSHAQLKGYLIFLKSRDLLAHSSDTYITTMKGLRFLESFAQLKDLLEEHARKIFVETSESYAKRATLKAFPMSRDTRRTKW